jgi:hypothetical protein
MWMHPHTITAINVAADFGELAEILGDGHAQTIPLHLCRGYKPLQSASHIYLIHRQGL